MSDNQRLLDIKRKKVNLLRKKVKYIEDNKLFYFNTSYMPANPLQQEIINAWNNVIFKVFTMTGANRIGKTTMSVILAFATMIGKWPWNMVPLPFPHRKARKIRYIGQDWKEHVETVVIPAMEDWWPKSRPVQKKRNHEGIEAFWKDVKTGSTLEIMTNKQDCDNIECVDTHL